MSQIHYFLRSSSTLDRSRGLSEDRIPSFESLEESVRLNSAVHIVDRRDGVFHIEDSLLHSRHCIEIETHSHRNDEVFIDNLLVIFKNEFVLFWEELASVFR